MAVARHSDKIEVQDETDYENDTTVTARTDVDMSVEGHYESLTKKDDAVYEDLRPKTKKAKGKKQQFGKITENINTPQ